MTPKKCPLCGRVALVEEQGLFEMKVPPNIPGDAISVSDTNWLHCESCGEDILSQDLEQAINAECQRRRMASVP